MRNCYMYQRKMYGVMNIRMINKNILKIQETHIFEEWGDVQINLNMLEECWKEAQKELLTKMNIEIIKLKTTKTTKVIDYIEFYGSLDELEASINLININTPDNVVLTYEIIK